MILRETPAERTEAIERELAALRKQAETRMRRWQFVFGEHFGLLLLNRYARLRIRVHGRSLLWRLKRGGA